MPIVNPNIIHSVMTQRQGPTRAISEELALRTQRERLRTEELQRQGAETSAAEQQRLRDIFANADPNNPDAAIGEAMRVAPAEGLKLRGQLHQNAKAKYDADKAQVAAKLEQATIGTQILQGVSDEASFQAAKAQLGRVLGPEAAAELGESYDPARVRAHVNAGTKVTEYLKAIDDQLTRQESARHNQASEVETTRHNTAGETETTRHNTAGETDAARDTTSRIGDRAKRTRIYEADLKGDRTETKRHNMASEIIAAQKGSVGDDAGAKQDFEEYKVYVQQWDRKQQANAKAAGAEVDDNGDPVGYDYQMPPAFREWRGTLERGTRPVAQAQPGDIALPPSQGAPAPIASVMAPPAAPPAPSAPPTAPAAQSVAAPKVQAGQIVTLRDGRRARVTGINPNTGKAIVVPLEGR